MQNSDNVTRRQKPVENGGDRRKEDDDNDDFFDLPVARLPDRPRQLVLAYSSSSEDPVLTTDDDDDDDDTELGDDCDPDALSDDTTTYDKLRREISSLAVRTNFELQKNKLLRPSSQPPKIPAKYLFDETGRRWSKRPTAAAASAVDYSSFPRPKHQDGRLKFGGSIIQKTTASTTTTPLVCWQYFLPDSLLESHITPWVLSNTTHHHHHEQQGSTPQNNKKKGGGGGKEKSAVNGSSNPAVVDLDELKAFIAILYARAACFGSTQQQTQMGDLWRSDPFTPSFFVGAMNKDKFFELLKCVASINENGLPASSVREPFTPPAFLNEFNYRLGQSFDPGDTLYVSDRVRRMMITAAPPNLLQSPPPATIGGSSGRQQQQEAAATTTKPVLISWLRDARCGFFFKMTATMTMQNNQNYINDTLILNVSNDKNDSDAALLSRRVDMDQTMRYLVGHAPIAGSGRTVYVAGTHAGVDCASEMYEKHKLRVVGRLPLAGFYDRRAPFLAKARNLLKRTSGSSLFLFDYPLALISYQDKPATRSPEVLISTAHYSKATTTNIVADSDDYRGTENFLGPPDAWLDYQRFLASSSSSDDNVDFCSLFFTTDQIGKMPLERICFFECLYAAAYNAFVAWELILSQQSAAKTMDQRQDFKTFLNVLASELVRGYVTDRLSSSLSLSSSSSNNDGWRPAAEMILRHLRLGHHEEAVEEGGQKSTGKVLNDQIDGNHDDVAGSASKKQQKKQQQQTKKRGKCKK